MINTRKLTEALEKKYRLNEDLVDLFVKYHDDSDNFRSNEHGFDEMYKILDKYGDPSEDVDEVFTRAPYSEQEKMVSLIEPKVLDESWEEEFDDEYDYIMDDDSLSDVEKTEKVKLLRQKYDRKNESLNLTESYYIDDDCVINSDTGDVDATFTININNSDVFFEITPKRNLSDKEKKSILGKVRSDLKWLARTGEFGTVPGGYGVYGDFNESLNESFWDPTHWFDDLVDNYENWTAEEWTTWDQEKRDMEVTKAIKHFLIDNQLSEEEALEFIDDLDDNNFHTEARIFYDLYNRNNSL